MSKNLDKVMQNLRKSKKQEEDVEEDLDEELEENEQEADTEETEATEKEEGEAKQEDIPAKEDPQAIKEGKEKKIAESRAREIELLQNDGVFRQQLLIQVIDLNKNLSVLNELVAIAIGGDDKDKTKKK